MEVGGQMLADKAEPGRVDAVQRPKAAVRIPPALRLCSEATDFAGIDGGTGRAQRLPILSARYIWLKGYSIDRNKL